jgi:hypothetical protein
MPVASILHPPLHGLLRLRCAIDHHGSDDPDGQQPEVHVKAFQTAPGWGA